MSGLVTHSAHGPVVQLTFANGTDNALDAAVCGALIQALNMALTNPKTEAVVITSKGPVFCAGLDLTWLEQAPLPQELLHLCDLIENAEKPVVMALQGDAIGAGFELALCGHYRVAAPNIRVGLPGISLDLPPVAGATQRLPRLIGAEATLQMLLSGGTITGAALGPVFDAEVSGEFSQGAIRFAMDILAEGRQALSSASRNEGFADPLAFQDSIRNTKERAAKIGPVADGILAAVEAAPLLPFTAGLELEKEFFAEHQSTPRARALRHMLMAEGKLAHRAKTLITSSQSLDHLAIVGGTPLGASLAARCLIDGLSVTYVVTQSETRAEILESIKPFLIDGLKSKGADLQSLDRYFDELETGHDLEACGGTDLVVDASQDKPEQKLRIFEDLGYLLPADTVLACTSSRVPLEDCAEASGRPKQVVGLHFPLPAHNRPVMELCRKHDISTFATSLAAQMSLSMGKSLVEMENIPGQSGATVLVAMWEMTDHLLRHGAGITQIDSAMRALGFAQGPCLALDQRGIRAALLLAKQVYHGVTADLPVLSAMSGEGLLGVRAGAGFYDFSIGMPQENPKAQDLIAGMQKDTRQTPSNQDIQSKIMAAMANAGARLLREGAAKRPSDIDVLMVNGYGVPRNMGGPMQHADTTGLLATKNLLSGTGKALQADPLLLDLIKNGQTFADLNR